MKQCMDADNLHRRLKKIIDNETDKFMKNVKRRISICKI